MFLPGLSVSLSKMVSTLFLKNWISYLYETSYKYSPTLDDMRNARTKLQIAYFWSYGPMKLKIIGFSVRF